MTLCKNFSDVQKINFDVIEVVQKFVCKNKALKLKTFCSHAIEKFKAECDLNDE